MTTLSYFAALTAHSLLWEPDSIVEVYDANPEIFASFDVFAAAVDDAWEASGLDDSRNMPWTNPYALYSL